MSITIRRVEFIGNPGYLCTCGIGYEEEPMGYPDDHAAIKCKNCGGYVSAKQAKEKAAYILKCNFPFSKLEDYR